MKYLIYNTVVESNVHLPHLLPWEGNGVKPLTPISLHVFKRDQLARRTSLRRVFRPDEHGLSWSLFRERSFYSLQWHGELEVTVSRSGSRVTCLVVGDDMPQNAVLFCLLELGLPLALHLRGITNFHASTVALPSGAVGFLGKSGQGKSTLAAAFARRGYPLVTDDVLAIQETPEGLAAYPGPPRSRLCSESIEPLSINRESLSSASEDGKFELGPELNWLRFCESPTPLRCLYILERGKDDPEDHSIQIEPLELREAAVFLFAKVWSLSLLDKEEMQQTLERVTRLANQAKVCHLRYPSDFEHIPRVIDAILEHQREVAPLAEARG